MDKVISDGYHSCCDNIQGIKCDNIQGIKSDNIQGIKSDNIQGIKSDNIQGIKSDNIQGKPLQPWTLFMLRWDKDERSTDLAQQ